MHQKFKRHQTIRILAIPNEEYVEYYSENKVPIKRGMKGKINMLLPNGQYHVELIDDKGNVIAYAPFNEEELEATE